jgi:hypothetical protein
MEHKWIDKRDIPNMCSLYTLSGINTYYCKQCNSVKQTVYVLACCNYIAIGYNDEKQLV